MAMSRKPQDAVMMERGLLGLVIRHRELMERIPPVSERDFLERKHARIWSCLKDGMDALADWNAEILAHRYQLDAQYLQGLSLGAPRGAKLAVQYANEIREWAQDRRIKSAAEAIAQFDGRGQQLRAEVERLMIEVMTESVTEGPERVGDGVDEYLRAKQHMIDHGDEAFITTSFPDLDRRMGSIKPGELVIVAGRPATGKTQLAISMAEANARIQRGVHVVSLEMMREQMIDRLVSRRGVPGRELRMPHQSQMPDMLMRSIREASDELRHLPIWVDYSSDDYESIAAHIRRMKRQHDTRLVIIDYLQLVEGDGTQPSRVNEVAKITRGLKRLAIQLEIPIVALAQLNRSVERRGDNSRPIMSDLRECGAIEQDADFIVFLWRHELSYGKPGIPETAAKGIVEAIVAKARQADPGTEYLRENFAYSQFLPTQEMEVRAYLNTINDESNSKVRSGY